MISLIRFALQAIAAHAEQRAANDGLTLSSNSFSDCAAVAKMQLDQDRLSGDTIGRQKKPTSHGVRGRIGQWLIGVSVENDIYAPGRGTGLDV